MNPKRALERVVVDDAKLPKFLRYKQRPLGEVVKRISGGDLVELVAYFDAQASIVRDELMRRATEEYGD